MNIGDMARRRAEVVTSLQSLDRQMQWCAAMNPYPYDTGLPLEQVERFHRRDALRAELAQLNRSIEGSH